LFSNKAGFVHPIKPALFFIEAGFVLFPILLGFSNPTEFFRESFAETREINIFFKLLRFCLSNDNLKNFFLPLRRI